MTETFDGFQIAGATRHFLVTYADVGDADEILRANAILSSCEADLATLETWFGCDFDKSPYSVWVQVLKGSPGAGAQNYGYTSSESSIIQIFGTGPHEGDYVTPGAVGQMLFVAELAEVLMSFTSHLFSGWNRGNSMGEGLSRVAAAELHPAGYYSAPYKPSVNGWLNANPRPDWVTSTEGTDKDSISYGCANVFLYYLRYQLGFSYTQIVAAGQGAGASTLGQVYATFTGKPASGALSTLEALLAHHFPVGASFQVPADNIFPLYKPPHISCVTRSASVGTPVSRGVTTFESSLCSNAVAQYSYETFSVITEIDVSAFAYDLVDGTFSWSINGVELAAPPATGQHTAQLYLEVPVEITDVAPPQSGNNLPPFGAEMGITYIINSLSPTRSQLLLQNTNAPGNGSLTITVTVRESLAAGEPAGTTDVTWPIETLSYTLSPSYWAAQWACIAKPVYEASAALTALGNLAPILNAPDPSPEQITAVAAAAASYLSGLQELTGGAIGQRSQVASVISAAQLSSRVAAPAVRAGSVGGPPVVSISSQTVRLQSLIPPPGTAGPGGIG